MPIPGWRQTAKLKRGESVVGRYIDRLEKLNPAPAKDPLSVLQDLFQEETRLKAQGLYSRQLRNVQNEISKLSESLAKKRKL